MTKEELIKHAMLWHNRMGHDSYSMIFELSKTTPDIPSFEELKWEDMLPCKICTSLGNDPYVGTYYDSSTGSYDIRY